MSLTPIVAQISPTGITAPSFVTILAWFQQQFQSIYGADAYIAPDSQDGAWIAILSDVVHDMNDALIASYQAYSPGFAQGAGLSSVVKINGITRQTASFSSAVGNIVGVSGTQIPFGVVEDDNGNLWNLPGPIAIPMSGVIAVTVTAQQPGAIAAPAGTINKINSPTLGWQSFLSTSDAVPGSPVETDAALRRRQATAASLPSQSPLAGVAAQLAQLPGVTRVQCYENDTNAADGNGAPAHSIYVVVEGGDVMEIAQTIGQKKTPGAATYGTTSENYIDPITGIAYTINFFILGYVEKAIVVTGNQKAGYNSNVGVEIQNSIAAYINSLPIGKSIEYLRLIPPAYLNGGVDNATYEITALTINGGTVDVPVAFNQVGKCQASDITIDIT